MIKSDAGFGSGYNTSGPIVTGPKPDPLGFDQNYYYDKYYNKEKKKVMNKGGKKGKRGKTKAHKKGKAGNKKNEKQKKKTKEENKNN